MEKATKRHISARIVQNNSWYVLEHHLYLPGRIYLQGKLSRVHLVMAELKTALKLNNRCSETNFTIKKSIQSIAGNHCIVQLKKTLSDNSSLFFILHKQKSYRKNVWKKELSNNVNNLVLFSILFVLSFVTQLFFSFSLYDHSLLSSFFHFLCIIICYLALYSILFVLSFVT